jgi:copper chaperone CopZ
MPSSEAKVDSKNPVESACQGATCGGCADTADTAAADSSEATTRSGNTSFRIATMDCATEESEIRRALEPIEGIHTLRFQLSERTLSMTGTPSAVELAQAAIRRAGFDPQLIQPDAAGTALTAEASGFFRGGVKRLIAALILATMAEAIGFIEAQSLVAQGLEIALAMAAIGLAGLDTYKKGLMALRHAKLNINALMTVAVTGAFLIGQWPEAAMVMALYAIAELIEARSVDRARNAIKGLMALAPEEARCSTSRWHMAHPEGQRGAPGRHCSHSPWRARAARWRRDSGQQRRQPGPSDRREHPRRQSHGRHRVRRHHQRDGRVAVSRDRRGHQHHPRSHHPRGRRGAGHAGSDPALCGQIRGHLHPDRVRDGAGCGPSHAVADGLDLDPVAVQGAGPAGHRLPLRAGDLHPPSPWSVHWPARRAGAS